MVRQVINGQFTFHPKEQEDPLLRLHPEIKRASQAMASPHMPFYVSGSACSLRTYYNPIGGRGSPPGRLPLPGTRPQGRLHKPC